ncbi:hypothetical protein BJ165DRAFT_1409749 [Panaeolus papilionaceus]|nr:hypothetical protein BJ165DRAFT_1409749 [Panaeolus papilionaceus]
MCIMRDLDEDVLDWNSNSLSDPASEASDSEFYSDLGLESGSDESEETSGEEVQVKARDELEAAVSIILTSDVLDYSAMFLEIADAYLEKEIYEDARVIYELLGGDMSTSSVYVLLQAAFFVYLCMADPTNNDAQIKLAEIHEISSLVRKALNLLYEVIHSRKKRKTTSGPTSDPIPSTTEDLTTPSLFPEDKSLNVSKAKPRAGVKPRLTPAQLRALGVEKEIQEGEEDDTWRWKSMKVAWWIGCSLNCAPSSSRNEVNMIRSRNPAAYIRASNAYQPSDRQSAIGITLINSFSASTPRELKLSDTVVKNPGILRWNWLSRQCAATATTSSVAGKKRNDDNEEDEKPAPTTFEGGASATANVEGAPRFRRKCSLTSLWYMGRFASLRRVLKCYLAGYTAPVQQQAPPHYASDPNKVPQAVGNDGGGGYWRWGVVLGDRFISWEFIR